MIAFMPESEGKVVGVRASGKLTGADYQRVLMPYLESMIDRHGRLRVLFLMDETCTGWDLRAAWANTVLDFRHRDDFEKVAVVGAPRWEEWCVKLAGLLIKGPMRTFPRHHLGDAWHWLRA